MHNVNLELFLVQANQQPAYQILQAAEASPTINITTVSRVTLVDRWRCVDFPAASVDGG